MFRLGRAAGTSGLAIDAAGLRALVSFIESARRDRMLPRPELGDEGYLGPARECASRDEHFRCDAGLTIGGIMWDGRIGACPELGDGFCQGDATHERFRDVWRDRYQVFRDRSWTRRDACEDCDRFDGCRGGSLHLYAHPHARLERCFYRLLGGE